MKKFSRRDFMIQTLGATTFAALSPWNLLAQSNDKLPHFFLIIQVEGGMDVTLGLDPQVHRPGIDQYDVFLEYSPSEILRYQSPVVEKQGRPILLGPSAAPLMPFASEMAVINGIAMTKYDSDLGHEGGKSAMIRGAGENSPPIPFLNHQNSFANPFGMLTANVRVDDVAGTTSSDVGSILSGSKSVFGIDAYRALELLSQKTADQPTAPYLEVQRTRANIKKMVQQKIQQVRDLGIPFAAGQAEMVAGFAAGVSSSGLFIIRNFQLDTHLGHEDFHVGVQRTVWEQVVNILNALKRTNYKDTDMSIYDLTTVMVTNDLARTPALNGPNLTGGKDHNGATNSAVLFGRGINGGQTLGATHVFERKKNKGIPIHAATPFDFVTNTAYPYGDNQEVKAILANKDKGNLIRPQNIASSLKYILDLPLALVPGNIGRATPIEALIKL